jgi:NADH:ubiquinone oxidoreductase subunit H
LGKKIGLEKILQIDYSSQRRNPGSFKSATGNALEALVGAIYLDRGYAFTKTFILLSIFIWLRASLPRYRYDQIMRLGWKVFIPLSVFWVVVVGAWIVSPWSVWK